MQRANKQWFEALVSRCVDARKAEKTPFLRIAAVTGVEELLRDHCEGKLILKDAKTGAQALDEVLSLTKLGMEIAFLDKFVGEMAGALPVTVAVRYLRHVDGPIFKKLLRKVLQSNRKDISTSGLLQLLQALQRTDRPNIHVVLDTSRTLLKKKLNLIETVSFLRCLQITGIGRRDIINPVLITLSGDGLFVHPKDISAKTACELFSIVTAMYTARSGKLRTGPAVDVLRKLIQPPHGYEMVKHTTWIVCLAKLIQQTPLGETSFPNELREMYTYVVGRFVGHHRHSDLTATDIVRAAWAAEQTNTPKLFSVILEACMRGFVWKELTNSDLILLLRAVCRTGHSGLLLAIAHRVATMELPIKTPLNRRSAVKMLESISTSKIMSVQPVHGKNFATRLAETISADLMKHNSPMLPSEACSCLVSLGSLRVVHHVLITCIHDTLKASENVKFTPDELAGLAWAGGSLFLESRPFWTRLTSLITCCDSDVAFSSSCRAAISWAYSVASATLPALSNIRPSAGKPPSPIVFDTRITVKSFV
eukprot:TRINITY_DN23092_c0_g1_i1.p1 TRINITY_DN23092_c0_g1~~TRINITY_DN23092_c0_g1_i1.p1  ORF type:complete len:537 (+),score=43.02 TRINITY_DN23092_c0_g1_i1:41-1651(+)